MKMVTCFYYKHKFRLRCDYEFSGRIKKNSVALLTVHRAIQKRLGKSGISDSDAKQVIKNNLRAWKYWSPSHINLRILVFHCFYFTFGTSIWLKREKIKISCSKKPIKISQTH